MPADPVAAVPPDSRRRWVVALIGAALFVFVFFLRFNTLGGALGGFDDDHFVPFAYAKQVQAGEEPLRDFTGIGLQGAWPSLTFELSAAAQSLLGNTLRSEALLSVIGIALAAVLTFLAASDVAPVPVAAASSVFAALLATRLYNYPKVVVLAAAVWLVGRFATAPTRVRVAALAVLTVIAFLLRHDYAVLVGVAVLAVVITAAGSMRAAARRLTEYAVIVVVLLTPSAIFVQSHGGIGAYLADCLGAVKQESGRTARRDSSFVWQSEDGRRLTAWSFLSEEQNAVQTLYYVAWVLPVVAFGLALVTREPGGRAIVLAWALLGLTVTPLYLRGNTAARFGDMTPIIAVLLATVLGRVRRPGFGRPAVLATGLMTVIALLAVAQSVWAVGGVMHDLDVSGWSHSPSAVIKQSVSRWHELGTLPRAYWAGTAERPSIAAVQYLHACTRSTDRVLLISYQPELLPLADRRFAAGRASVIPGLLTDEAHQRNMIEIWNRESVPIVLVEPAEEHVYEIPILYRYLVERYVDSGPLPVDGSKVLHVYVERQRTPSGQFGPQLLPCFG
jgi:hypothetical protein